MEKLSPLATRFYTAVKFYLRVALFSFRLLVSSRRSFAVLRPQCCLRRVGKGAVRYREIVHGICKNISRLVTRRTRAYVAKSDILQQVKLSGRPILIHRYVRRRSD